MKLVCLCPTYGRPHLVQNALGCFLAQDYPDHLRRMLILDDAGQIAPQRCDGWEVISTPIRFPSLPAKYNRLLELVGDYDAVIVWDDDDIYLPWHLSAHAAALRNAAWSHPREVWSLYTGKPELEHAAGRFHGALAIRRDLINEIGGWIQTRRADFDQQQIGACQRLAGPPGRPDENNPPSYIFRWASTGAPHCQGLMSSPKNEDWYDRYVPQQLTKVAYLSPSTDVETSTLLDCPSLFSEYRR